jgi:hypothetical protein
MVSTAIESEIVIRLLGGVVHPTKATLKPHQSVTKGAWHLS